MVLHLLPVETQLEIYSRLPRRDLDRMCLVNRRCSRVVTRYEHRLARHRLTMVITGTSRRYRLHNFDVGRMLVGTYHAFYDLLRNARIEFILVCDDEQQPLPNLDHLSAQLTRWRRHWTGATVSFRQLPLPPQGWHSVLNLFANANRWYFNAANVLFPVSLSRFTHCESVSLYGSAF